MPIPRLHGRGRLTELYQSDLRFTSEEIAQFLNLVLGLGLSAGDVAALERRTEGWIAGLQMAAFGEEVELMSPAMESLIEPLSERELEVLRLVVVGLSNPEIAKELVIAVSTVQSHVNHIYGKLGVESRTRAVARAQELGLL